VKKLFPACIALTVLILAASCAGKKEAPPEPAMSESASAAPIIDTSKAEIIEARLAKYDEIVPRYLADSGGNNAEALAADEEELAGVSEELSELAADFDSDQLKKYNEITERLTASAEETPGS